MLVDEDQKSCEAATFAEPPNERWGVEDLGRYARVQDEVIAAGEHALCPVYWRLGLALSLARRQFVHGQWTRFLRQHEIDKTRAARARAIYRTFEAEEQVAQLSVEEAYRRRKRKPRTPKATKVDVTPTTPDVMTLLLSVCREADRFTEQMVGLSADQTATIITTIEETIAELEKLRDRFRDGRPVAAF